MTFNAYLKRLFEIVNRFFEQQEHVSTKGKNWIRLQLVGTVVLYGAGPEATIDFITRYDLPRLCRQDQQVLEAGRILSPRFQCAAIGERDESLTFHRSV